VLELVEATLDQVAHLVGLEVVWNQDFSRGIARDHRFGVHAGNDLAQGVGVIGLVGQDPSGRQAREQSGGLGRRRAGRASGSRAADARGHPRPCGSWLSVLLGSAPKPGPPFLAAALAGGRLLVGPHQRGVERDVVVVRIVDEVMEHPCPDPGLGPTGEAPVERLPLAVTVRQVVPVCAGAQHLQDAVHKGQIVLRCASRLPHLARQHRFDPPPLGGRQLVSLRLGPSSGSRSAHREPQQSQDRQK
jgi:hypothetical protein